MNKLNIVFPVLLVSMSVQGNMDSTGNNKPSSPAHTQQEPARVGTTIQLPDSGLYEGKLKNGLLSGHGSLSWRNGDSYTGEFRDGLMHGKGKYVYVNSAIYEGEFADGLWNGKGQIVYSTGDEYTGEFKNGKLHGKGKFIERSGAVYAGDFSEDEFTGEGKIILSENEIYEGEVKKWKMHGKGIYKNEDVTYSGYFFEGEMNGEGEIRYRKGGYYKGQVKDWLANGKGQVIQGSGNRYQGEFADNLYHGKGTLRYVNGDVYTGDFETGFRHGMGVFTRKKPKGRKKITTGYWKYDQYIAEKKPKDNKKLAAVKRLKNDGVDVEKVFYKQSTILKSTFSKIKPSNANKPDMYFLGFAAYGSQDVFMKEALYAQKVFDSSLDTAGRSITLINNKQTVDKIALASVTNLELTLSYLSKVMDTENDILFMYLTSHGSKDHELSVSMKGFSLNDLPAAKMAEIIKASGIKWKVIAISSCYSGGFINKLKDENTLIMTASKSDHVSFGCSDEAEFTYFGRALFKKSIPATDSFVAAFQQARTWVGKWEDKENYDHSNPQFWTHKNIEQQLQIWRKTLVQKTAWVIH